ncbi:hypothetical protein AAG906_039965 [Vitis piasezkii]
MRFLLLLSSFYLTVVNSSSSMQQPLCHDSESSALLQFKQSFLIDEDASNDPFAYPKVAMETGHVIGLHLARSCLYGSINSNSTLFSLVHLQRLNLSDNDFNCSVILFGVGQLSRLRSLDLSFSRFSSQIPSELLALSKLVFLDLSGNPMLQLQKPGLRNLVQNLTHLKTHHLSYVNISSTVPHALANLSSLTSLLLRKCGLHGEFPMTIFRLPSLRYLSVRYNPDLIGYLPEFQETSPLEMLHLAGTSFSGLDACNLTKIPDFLQKQDELKFLSLSNNKIHGPIPKWIPSGNFLIGLDQPPVVLPWSRLKSLNLDSNMLQGPLPIPPPLTSEYFAFGNKLIGEISPLICNMSSLMLLDLSSNNLSGRIPQCLANFSKSLFVLDLGNNHLDGPIPQTCTVPNNLRVIDLGENQFQGQIPRSFANCMMLEHLVLGNNEIDDIFPFWLGALPQLQVLILRSNRFHGAIGSWHANLRFPKLRIIDLSGNEFIGDLPSLYFQNWDAMKLADANHLEYMRVNQDIQSAGHTYTFNYMYSMTMTNKGMQRFYEEIPDIFIAIDFSGLCGSPLSRACESSEASPPTLTSSKQGSTREFDWKFVLMGYGSGLVIGVSIGYCLTSWKHEWFMKTFGKWQRKWTRKERRGQRS